MTKRSISHYFDLYATEFNSIYEGGNFLQRLITNFFRKSIVIRYAKTIEGCAPIQDKTVLDIGCGPGYYAIKLAKRGASSVVGIDFSDEMINIARGKARKFNIEDRCKFISADFLEYQFDTDFDYSIIMGLMDYIANPHAFIHKVISLTKQRAFFSFPIKNGLLAWQRKLRYKCKCDLFLYDKDELKELFSSIPCKEFEIEKINRDFFVTVTIG